MEDGALMASLLLHGAVVDRCSRSPGRRRAPAAEDARSTPSTSSPRRPTWRARRPPRRSATRSPAPPRRARAGRGDAAARRSPIRPRRSRTRSPRRPRRRRRRNLRRPPSLEGRRRSGLRSRTPPRPAATNPRPADVQPSDDAGHAGKEPSRGHAGEEPAGDDAPAGRIEHHGRHGERAQPHARRRHQHGAGDGIESAGRTARAARG